MAAGGGLGPHVGGPWKCQGLVLGPAVARGRQNGLHCTGARARALFYKDPRIQVTANVEGGFDASGPYYQSNNCLIRGTFISELLDWRLRKVTVELLTGLLLRSLVAPSKEGPAELELDAGMPFEVHFGCWGWPWTSCWRPLEMPRAWPGSRSGPGIPEWAGLHSPRRRGIVSPG